MKILKVITKVVYAVASKESAKYTCCANKLIKNGFKIINIKILKAPQYNTLLKISKQGYICESCNKSFTYKLKLVNDNCSISNDIKLAIKLELKEAKSEKTIAKQFNVSPSTVNRSINDLPDYKADF